VSPCNRLASIDIGTNSVLLTIVELADDGQLQPLYEAASITRIGEGLGTTGNFCAAAMDRTATVLQEYSARCQEYDVEGVVAAGTAAFRKAQNSQTFIERITKACGFTIQIVSGEKEAQLAFHAAAHDFGADIMVLDIGGGSTEFIWPTAETIEAHSFPLGSVSLHEAYCTSDPIDDTEYDIIREATCSALALVQRAITTAPPQLVALAGTATTLAAMHLKLEEYQHDQVHGHSLTRQAIETLLAQLRGAKLEERRVMAGLEPARADVILAGTILLAETMRIFDYDEVTISDRGVRWGMLYEAISGQRGDKGDGSFCPPFSNPR
jgi:exopolyphosphatase / guanosine-5'-triphosphate,3'-diphosphate pyrophosphatase